MSLETGTVISELVATNPTKTDPKYQGDDHLRLIKSVLQSQFPDGVGGSGLTTPILSTSQELNWLQGLTSSVQGQINALESGGGDLSGQVAINTSDILTNAANIASNDTEIANITTRVGQLEFDVSFIEPRIDSLENVRSMSMCHINGSNGAVTDVHGGGVLCTKRNGVLGTYDIIFGEPSPGFKVLVSCNGVASIEITDANSQEFTIRTYQAGGVLYDSPQIQLLIVS